jgi:hypothetical protein
MDEQTTVVTDVETPEAFLADRQQFWTSFTHFVIIVAVLVAITLILMRLFLL